MANILQVTQQLNKSRVKLRGDMNVALNEAVTSSFSIIFFTTTTEVFNFSTQYSLMDLNGTPVTLLKFGGHAGLFMELMFDPTSRVWYITASNSADLGGSSHTLVSQYPWETSGQIALPTIGLVSSSTSVTATSNLTLTATVSSVTQVSKVEFYRGNTLINTDTASPFVYADAITSAYNGTLSYTAKVYDILGRTVTSSAISVTVNVPIVHTKPEQRFDATTQAAYDTAITGATTGNKRLAAANALVSAFAPDHRMYIYHNNGIVVPIEYTGGLTVVNDGYDIYVQPSVTIDSSNPVATGDLTTGQWWFELQGGTNYDRVITGTVGNEASGAELQLQSNPAPGQGITSIIKFVMPRSLDGLV
jgi:hypothetical protein